MKPLSEMEVLDALAWTDALLAAGWCQWASDRYEKEWQGEPGKSLWKSKFSYPMEHCLSGAVEVAIGEVVGRNTDRWVPLIRAMDTVMDWIYDQAMPPEYKQRAKEEGVNTTSENVLVWFNDTPHRKVEEVRALVQDAAAALGSK